MGLFELFREKQIKIMPETQVTIKYFTAEKPADLFALAEGDVLLVKKQITQDDQMILNWYPGNSVVFTTRPETLEALDAQKELAANTALYFLDSIGLDYLHFKETLLVFGHINGVPSPSSVPNIVCITPVHREEIETQLSINLEVIRKTLGKPDEETPEKKEAPKAGKPSEGNPITKSPTELELVRRELKNRIEEKYTIVRTQFSGTSIESTTVRLTEFYRKHGIEKGRLRGSWIIFERGQVGDIMETGLVRKAVDLVYKGMSVSIPSYGRLVSAERITEFRSAMEKIEDEYRRYLSGDRNCKNVGGIPINKPFAPWDAMNESFAALLAYLIDACPVKGLETENYIDDVKKFVYREQNKQNRFTDKVSLEVSEMSFKEGQLEDRRFIMRLYQAVMDNSDFFDKETSALLKRYVELMNKENRQRREP